MTERLVRRDDREGLAPRLVEEVPTFKNGLARIDADVSEGRLVATFRLRQGLVWHDGAALTSDDVAFAWSLDREAPRGSLARADANLIDRIDTPDARTAVVYLRPGVRTARYPLLPRALPRHLHASADAAARLRYSRSPVHAGPFVLASRDQGGMTLLSFDRYALGAPGLSRVEVRFFTDREALLDALASGRVDLVPAGFFSEELIPRLERFVETRALVARYTPQESAEMLLFNLRSGPYRDQRVRQAVALAIDRRAIVDEVFGGRLRLPGSYLYAPSWAAEDVTLPDADPVAARTILGTLGHCVSTRCPPAFSTLRARVVVEGGNAPRLRAAELVVRDLERAGLVATLVAYSGSELAEALRAGEFDLAIITRDGADATLATEEYVSGSATNLSGYANPWFDALAAVAMRGLARAQSKPLYAELQRVWSADLPALPLYQRLAVDVVPASLEGVAPAAGGEPLSWNAHAWRFTK